MYDELIGELYLVASGVQSKNRRELLERAADAIAELMRRCEQFQYMPPPAWIPVTERLPETGHDVLVKFPQNMAVASIDMGGWVVNSGDGWCTDINLNGGEKNPTHWMELPQPPKEE